MNAGCEVECYVENGVGVIAVFGDATCDDVGEMRMRLSDALFARSRHIIVDLTSGSLTRSAVQFLCQALYWIRNGNLEDDGTVSVVDPSKRSIAAIEDAGLSGCIGIFDSRPRARAAIRTAGLQAATSAPRADLVDAVADGEERDHLPPAA